MKGIRIKKQDRARRYATNLLTQQEKTLPDIVAAKERVDANEK